MNTFFLNISEKYNSFIWIPDKTATSLAVNILKNFGFTSYSIVDDKVGKEIGKNNLVQQHMLKFFDGHEKYKFISTMRNPYTRYVSKFKFTRNPNKEIVDLKFEFQEFLESEFQRRDSLNIRNYNIRTPDNIIRVENLLEDYQKIDYIRNSEFNKSGELKSLIDLNINKNIGDWVNWKDFYNNASADLVYYNNSNLFDLFGYDKNSYKK